MEDIVGSVAKDVSEGPVKNNEQKEEEDDSVDVEMYGSTPPLHGARSRTTLKEGCRGGNGVGGCRSVSSHKVCPGLYAVALTFSRYGLYTPLQKWEYDNGYHVDVVIMLINGLWMLVWPTMRTTKGHRQKRRKD